MTFQSNTNPCFLASASTAQSHLTTSPARVIKRPTERQPSPESASLQPKQSKPRGKGWISYLLPFLPWTLQTRAYLGRLHKSNKLFAAITTLRNEIHPIYYRWLQSDEVSPRSSFAASRSLSSPVSLVPASSLHCRWNNHVRSRQKPILTSLIKFTSITYLNDTGWAETQLGICNIGSCTNMEQNKQIIHNLTKQRFHSTCLF